MLFWKEQLLDRLTADLHFLTICCSTKNFRFLQSDVFVQFQFSGCGIDFLRQWRILNCVLKSEMISMFSRDTLRGILKLWFFFILQNFGLAGWLFWRKHCPLQNFFLNMLILIDSSFNIHPVIICLQISKLDSNFRLN